MDLLTLPIVLSVFLLGLILPFNSPDLVFSTKASDSHLYASLILRHRSRCISLRRGNSKRQHTRSVPSQSGTNFSSASWLPERLHSFIRHLSGEFRSLHLLAHPVRLGTWRIGTGYPCKNGQARSPDCFSWGVCFVLLPSIFERRRGICRRIQILVFNCSDSVH